MKKLIESQKYIFRNKYYADDNGHIWSENKLDYLSEYNDKDGYKKVKLMTTDKDPSKGHRFSVHRLILSTFNPVNNMNNLQVDHIDGDKTNNNLSNLKWTTAIENLNNPNTKPNRRVYDLEGTHNASAKITELNLILLVNDINSGNYTRKQICNKYSLDSETLRRFINKETYKNELKDIEIIPNFISDLARDVEGEKNPHAKLDNEKVLLIIKLIQSKKYTLKEIALMYEINVLTISKIKNKRSWTHLTKDIDFN